MDNITHSLMGAVIGRAAAPLVGPGRHGRRWAIITGMIGANLPDIDLAWMELMPDPQIGYLLHHRGHTHTLALIPLMAAAVGGPLLWAARREAQQRRQREGQTGAVGLVAVAAINCAVHILADSWNNYGVHPFWPIANRWYYGDTIFIVEPWLWAALGPAAFWIAPAGRWWGWGGWRRARVIGAVIGAVAAGALVGPGQAAAWVTGVLVWGLISGGLAGAGRWEALCLGTGGLVGAAWLAFAIGSAQARAELAEELGQQVPEERLVDAARAPMPGVPWCWWVVAKTEAPGGIYTLRSGIVSLWPERLPPDTCAFWDDSMRTIKLRPVEFSPDPRWVWEGQWSRPKSELAAIVAGGADVGGAAVGCAARGLLGFARMAWWEDRGEADGQSRYWIGDLRYDFQPGQGFAEAEISPETPCMGLPAWGEDNIGRYELQ